MKTQIDDVLDYLTDGNTLTPLEALQMFGSLRLSHIIWKLRGEGFDIKTEMINVATRNGVSRVAQYSIE